MSKGKLRLDELRVETFETVKQEEARGTVRGHVTGTRCPDCTYNGEATCYMTDVYTCDVGSCPQTCQTECGCW